MDQFLCGAALAAGFWACVYDDIHAAIMGVIIALILIAYKLHREDTND